MQYYACNMYIYIYIHAIYTCSIMHAIYTIVFAMIGDPQTYVVAVVA